MRVTLQQLTREEFLNLAGDWFDKNYPTLFGHYLSKGKAPPIRIPSRKNIIKELFQKYLKNDHLRKRYTELSQKIRTFRNVVVHDVQIGRLNIDGQIYIPRSEVINDYRTWREVFGAINKPEIIAKDFRLKKSQLESELYELENALNEIWALVINEFLTEFYIKDRRVLRDLFCIEVTDN